VGENTFENWLAPLELERITEGALLVWLTAPTRCLQHWVYTHYFDRLLKEWHTEDKRVALIKIILPPGMDDGDDRTPDEYELVRGVTPEHQEAWCRILERLKAEIGQGASDWLKCLELDDVERLEVIVTLVAPTQLIRDRVVYNYFKSIYRAWETEDERRALLIIRSLPSRVMAPVEQNNKISDLEATRCSKKIEAEGLRNLSGKTCGSN